MLILVSALSRKHFTRFLQGVDDGFRRDYFPENNYYKNWSKVIKGLAGKKNDMYCLTQSYSFIYMAHEILKDQLLFIRIEEDGSPVLYDDPTLEAALEMNLEIR